MPPTTSEHQTRPRRSRSRSPLPEQAGNPRQRNRDHDASNTDPGSNNSTKQREGRRFAKALFTKEKSSQRDRHVESDDPMSRRGGGRQQDYSSVERDSKGKRERRNEDDVRRAHSETKERTKNPAVTSTTSAEPMILVTVNDRLGTKAQIPCLATDNVGLFKAMVAQRIGRKPHELMLKRQGERPFKDILTLADYGVSNGVQLDLELNTGD